MPNIRQYHESLTVELDGVKNRIRSLVTHWPTDGEWKEAALRTVLRRHLPGGTLVGRGFIIGRNESSTQIDLLVLKQEKPTLFRDGDLAIVTPDVPRAIAEVKTNLEGGAAWYEAAEKLAKNGELCKRIAKNEPMTQGKYVELSAHETNYRSLFIQAPKGKQCRSQIWMSDLRTLALFHSVRLRPLAQRTAPVDTVSEKHGPIRQPFPSRAK